MGCNGNFDRQHGSLQLRTKESTMEIFIFILVFAVIFGVFAGIASVNKTEERTKELNKATSAIPDFQESASVMGVKGLYKFAVDKKHKKVLYLKGPIRRIVPFEKIMSVSVNEDNTSIISKSSLRTIGGAVIGGALAGGAGTIVGGLSGNSTMKKKVSKVQVIIKLRDLNMPSLVIDCFDARTMTTEGKSELKVDSMEGYIYKTGLQNAQQIADMVSVIIDMEDQGQETENKQLPKDTSSVIADLEKLASLKEKGVLTEEEFNIQKKLLLNSSTQIAEKSTEDLSNPTNDIYKIENVRYLADDKSLFEQDFGKNTHTFELYVYSVQKVSNVEKKGQDGLRVDGEDFSITTLDKKFADLQYPCWVNISAKVNDARDLHNQIPMDNMEFLSSKLGINVNADFYFVEATLLESK